MPNEPLIDQIVAAQRDVVSLLSDHEGGLTPAIDSLDDKLTGRLDLLCRLLDLQARFIVCRYRTVALSQLVALATVPVEPDRLEVSELQRKACVDLARLAWTMPEPIVEEDEGESRLREIGKMIYGEHWEPPEPCRVPYGG